MVRAVSVRICVRWTELRTGFSPMMGLSCDDGI